MNGNLLALGAVGAIALGAATSRFRTRGNRNEARLAPGFRPACPVPGTHSLDLVPFFFEDVPSWATSPDAGLYHVTTNLPAVLASGCVLSRAELRAASRPGELPGIGLGGGFASGWYQPSVASDRVSVGVRLDASLRTLRATRLMARVARGDAGPADALAEWKEIDAEALALLARVFTESDIAWTKLDMAWWTNWRKRVLADLQKRERAILRMAIPTGMGPAADRARWEGGRALYDAIARWEGVVFREANWIYRHLWSRGQTAEPCGLGILFTATGRDFARADPASVGLVQLAARVATGSAGVDANMGECELRFRSADLVLAGVYEEPVQGSAARGLRSEAVRNRQARAVRLYGTTDDPGSAGFVLTSGDWLDFNEGRGGGQRAQDHRNIAQLLAPAERAPDSSVTDDMHRWMDLAHAVRVNVSGNYRRGDVDVMLDFPRSRAGLLDVQANAHVLQRFLRNAGATRVEVNGVVRRPRMLWDGRTVEMGRTMNLVRRLRTEHVTTEIDPYRWHAVGSFIQSVLDNQAPRQDEPYGSEP